MRQINRTPLETFMRSYVKQHKRNRESKAILNKALTRIEETITPSCCNDPTAVVNLHTPNETAFTLTISALIRVSTRNKQSMKRTKKMLTDYINGACCPENN